MKTIISKLGLIVGMFAIAQAYSAQLGSLPEFKLQDLDGKEWKSSDFAGKVVLVDFWATWCATCQESVPKLAQLQEKYKDKGLTIVGISVDKGSVEKLKKAAKKLGVNYLVLQDKDISLKDAFGLNGIPSVYVFDRAGKLHSALPEYDAGKEAQLEQAMAQALN